MSNSGRKDPILELRGVQVRHGERVVVDVPSLTIAAHETLAVIGPNGAGKSTLLHLLALLTPLSHEGTLLFRGQALDPRKNGLTYRRRIAIVFQEPLLCDATVFDNTALGLRFRKRPAEGVTSSVAEWLERFGVSHLSQRSARTLSGGEAQRVSLARAFAVEPEVLLLDEPFSALDAPARSQLLDDLREVLSATRTTTVFVTHHRNEALTLGDRVAVMLEGRIQQVDTPVAVFNAPVSEAVARFVGMETIVPASLVALGEGVAQVRINAHTLTAAVGPRLRGSASQSVLLCLRPEDVLIATSTEATTPSGSVPARSNSLDGCVTHISPFGGQLRVRVDCGFPLVALLTRQAFFDLALTVGQKVTASFKASAVHLIQRDISEG